MVDTLGSFSRGLVTTVFAGGCSSMTQVDEPLLPPIAAIAVCVLIAPFGQKVSDSARSSALTLV